MVHQSWGSPCRRVPVPESLLGLGASSRATRRKGSSRKWTRNGPGAPGSAWVPGHDTPTAPSLRPGGAQEVLQVERRGRTHIRFQDRLH
jgi:hypothetical protein